MRTLSATLLVVASLAGATARAQIMSSPVQDYINRTTLLDNILSNSRATTMSSARADDRFVESRLDLHTRTATTDQLERLLGTSVDRMTIDDTGVRQ
jgi:hypothetical protein